MSSVPEDQRRQTAALVERDNPLWLVIWGVYSHVFWAYARFDVPAGTILHARDTNLLVGQMRQVERRYIGSPRWWHHEGKPSSGEIVPMELSPEGEEAPEGS